ncbi:syntaxin-binding protein 5-like isoform X9 [Mya arenaria]|uniref:syntaxin-binding protein 5-like isoform X9 n=1 Tax=Mya arenaria TaxID=6604 RepID=UPI0022E93DF6|nr:syntaxin-binding protein 5-like isoform X9 [Mya arenaria]
MAGKMAKKFNIRGMFDGLRQSVSSSSPKSESDIEETIRSEDIQVAKTVRHGFPYQPTAMAFDSVQHILAIGTKSGSLRIFGQPGVDLHCHHGADVSVLQILFLVNEGALVTFCSDDNIHLWNYRQKRPEIVHSLKFQRERITCCHLSFQSKWLYVGTDKGNVHVVNIESFSLSGYVIMWNKAISLSRKTHPGPVLHLSDCPLDPSKLLIGFECGAIIFWDLKNKSADCRHQAAEPLRSISWHSEGKQFMSSHSDGSLLTWNVKTPGKPASIITPHAKPGKDGKTEQCKPITKVEWKSVRNGLLRSFWHGLRSSDPLVIFSGGMSYDRAGRTPCITVMTGKTTTVLEMEHTVIDFVVMCETPWQNDFQDPYAIVVLLQNDLVVIDLTSPGYPCFENPYPMDIHESPVTACQYFADCQTDLIPALYSVGSSKQKRSGFSEKRWPIKGGEWGASTCSYPEIVVTGHADGTVKFWDASAVTLQVLYKLKTAKLFEKPKNRVLEGQEDDPFAIYMIYLDQESRLLTLAGATHVMLFKFSKSEATLEVPSLDVSIVYEVFDDLDSPELDYPKPSLGVASQHNHSGSMGSHSSNASDSAKQSKPSLSVLSQQQKSGGSMGSYSSDGTRPEQMTALRVRPGSRKYPAGYHPDVVCLLTWTDNEHPGNVTSICTNSNYGLLAFGNESGLAIVDIVQKSCLLNLGTPDLYGFKENHSHLLHHQHNNHNQHKNDGSSFSRSRSSSMSSLENVSREAIQCLVFTDSYTRKFDNFTSPCLWVGTSLGSVLVIVLNLPPSGDQRLTQPVIVSPSGTIFRLKGPIQCMSFLDCNGVIIPTLTSGAWRDSARDEMKNSKLQSTPQKLKLSPSSSTEVTDRQFAIICSEKQARVVSLPSQTCPYKARISENSFVVKADVVNLRGDSVCLACYVANGHIMVYSLPSLKLLLDIDFLPLSDLRVARTFCFSNIGHAMYMCSPTELQKITYSAEFCDNLSEMLGELFLPMETPEPPKQGFFKNLFGGGPSMLDREELFGESSGKSARGLATRVPGSGGIQGLQSQTQATVAGEVSRARQLLSERGEKLSGVSERTEEMAMQAEAYSNTAHQIMLKYKDKKWYQF